MADSKYKNIRIKGDTFGRLKDEKRDYETWDGFMHRVLDSVEEEE